MICLPGNDSFYCICTCVYVSGGQQCDTSFGQHPEERRLGRVDPALSGTGPHWTHQRAAQLSNWAQTPWDGWCHEKNTHLCYHNGNTLPLCLSLCVSLLIYLLFFAPQQWSALDFLSPWLYWLEIRTVSNQGDERHDLV